MSGRPLIPEDEISPAFRRPAFAVRRRVLRETLDVLGTPPQRARFHALAAQNLARWKAALTSPPGGALVRVVPGDWGEVTEAVTRTHGVPFAVLNMANAHTPGGGYVEGCPAQEENMFRRTDCHFAISDDDLDPSREQYRPAKTRLLEAAAGRVYLDTSSPRVCVRGPEDSSRADLGYAWLAEDRVFPFFELRAAARDLRRGAPFDPTDARRRIAAQLDTLVDAGTRHAVLSAFGCGAFLNPAPQIAVLYAEELEARSSAFERIVFAIFHPGYGPDNFTPFRDALGCGGA